MTTFDWDRLAQKVFDMMYDGDNAAAYIRTRIEAEFVPVKDHDERVRVLQEHMMDERDLRVAATARAEAAEAENARLRDVIKRASDAPMLDHNGQQRGVYDILRQALGGEHE
jgi:hypothetical protein